MKLIFRILSISLRNTSSRIIFISYSLFPSRNLESVFPLKAVLSVCPTEAIFNPRAVILSLSMSIFISGLPSVTDNSTSDAPGMFLRIASDCLAYFITSSREFPVMVICRAACSAPIMPIGTIFTFTPGRIFSNSLLSLAEYTFVDFSALWSFFTNSTVISDL